MKKIQTAHNFIAFDSIKATFLALLCFFSLILTLEHFSYAAINESFTYQGKIVNSDGTNMTNADASCIVGGADTCDIRVSLYTASSGGTLVWQETKSNIEIADNDGIFNLVLDCGGTFDSCDQNGGPDFTSGDLFIEVEFDPNGNGDFAEGETFSPRRELTATPYAFHARSADQLGGQADTAYLRSDTDDQFEVGNTLDIAGVLDITGSWEIGGVQVDATAVEIDYLDNSTVDTGGLIFGNGTNFTQDLTQLYWNAAGNQLGVGTSNPSATLDIVGDLETNGGATITGAFDFESYGAIGNGSSPSANIGLTIDYDATYTGVGQQLAVLGTIIGAANTNVYGVNISPESTTIPSGTTPLAASLAISEPTITEIGTLTNAATLYIQDAPTEADNNYALWVDAGAVQIDDTLDVNGTFTSGDDWSWNATTPTINLASGEVLAMTDSTDTFSIDTSNSAFSFTDGTNSFTFDADTGPVYVGTARPTRQITLAPEYAGATFTGDGTNNTGTMTSDFCENGVSANIPDTNTAICNTSGDIHNYYSWTTGAGSAQDYDIWIRWRVPDNFSSWNGTNPITAWGKRTDATNNAVTIYVYDTTGTVENSGGTQVSGTNWTETAIEPSFSGTYTPGQYMTIRIVLNADTGGDSVQVGELSLNYRSSN